MMRPGVTVVTGTLMSAMVASHGAMYHGLGGPVRYHDLMGGRRMRPAMARSFAGACDGRKSLCSGDGEDRDKVFHDDFLVEDIRIAAEAMGSASRFCNAALPATAQVTHGYVGRAASAATDCLASSCLIPE